jgi:exonuclease SbcD
MSKPFRFLHLSDLRLGEPVTGVQVPTGDLRQRLLDAPYLAAEKAFNIAIREQVEFILLTGNVLDLHQPSPKPVSFLQRQFERLLSSGIEVYWCSGPIDPSYRWPAAIELPNNVTQFGSQGVEVTQIQNEHGPVCTLIACGAQTEIEPEDFRLDSVDGLVIGAVNGLVDLQQLDEIPCDYWALGGRRHRRVIARDSRFAIYPGSPQSRGADHAGACGVNLVSVDGQGGLHSKELACDSVRFFEQKLSVEIFDLTSIREALFEAHAEAAETWEDGWCIIDWTLTAEDSADTQIPTRQQQRTLAEELRTEFGTSGSKIWCNQLRLIDPMNSIPNDLLEEDSILGDFLRSLPEWENAPDRAIDLLSMLDLPSDWANQSVTEPLKHFDRSDLLVRIRKMGLELLSGTAEV